MRKGCGASKKFEPLTANRQDRKDLQEKKKSLRFSRSSWFKIMVKKSWRVDRTGMGKKVAYRGGIAGAWQKARRPELVEAGYYVKLSRTAMACQFEIFLPSKDRSLIPAAQEAFDEIDRLENQISVYRSDSEISLLNQTAAQTHVQVESRLYRLLLFARQIGAETNGAFDLTIGALIRCWGFLERTGRVPPPDELAAAKAVSGWNCIEFVDATHSISFLRRGVELNLGSIGKGYAIDRAAELLRRSGLRNFLIHGGHSSIIASGDSESGPGWEIGLRDPDRAGGYGSVRLQNQAMSTSGMGQQFFTTEYRRFGHILDPRSGRPAEQNSLVSVVAGDATMAEAFSTAFFALGESDIRRCCEERQSLGAIIFPLAQTSPTPKPLVLGIALERRAEEPS
jgi:FAD:protein FMN transferase